MKIIRNTSPISDLNSQMQKGELKINKDYQRFKGLWPPNARSYFIDTVLNEYPFPKIVIRQMVDLKTKQTCREIIDGQQRLTSIKDFIDDKLVLSTVSNNYKGLTFSQLDDDIKEKFLSYEVSMDNVISATEEEILEIFRRINSYTLPLNDPEKRHATYQGKFKWFIKDLIEQYSNIFEQYQILTKREISRMMDADLMTEICQVITDGIKSRSARYLESLYKRYDKKFDNIEEVKEKITDTLDFIKVELNKVLDAQIIKSYMFYSLFSALVFNRYGITLDESKINLIRKTGYYTNDINQSIQNIMSLLSAYESRDEKGQYSEFVKASTGTTHSVKHRLIRFEWFVKALQNNM